MAHHLSLLLLVFIFRIPASGQEVQFRDSLNLDKGHWQIFTNPFTHNTVIKFFDGQKNQFYQENLAGKYIKLTNRNIAKINQIFDQMASKTVVQTQVASDSLSSPAYRKLSDLNSKRQSLREKENDTSPWNIASRLKVHAFQMYDKEKVTLIFQNPDQTTVNITLSTLNEQVLYKEVSTEINYRRSFNLQALEDGKYKLVVSHPNRKQSYIKQIEINSTENRKLHLEKQVDVNCKANDESASW